MSLPKDTRFWIGISFIVISVSGILLWVVLTDPVNFTPIQNFLIQIILTVCGSFGSFLIGVPIQESRPQIRVKDRYENLLAVFLGIREVIGYIQFIEEKPRLAEQQKN